MQLSSEQNSPLSLHFTQIKSQECRVSQMVCHNPGWSIHPPQNCGLEHFSLWCLHSLHFYFLHIFSQMPANLRGLNGQQYSPDSVLFIFMYRLLAYFYCVSLVYLSQEYKLFKGWKYICSVYCHIPEHSTAAHEWKNEQMNWMQVGISWARILGLL